MIEIVQIIHMMIQAAEKYYGPINTVTVCKAGWSACQKTQPGIRGNVECVENIRMPYESKSSKARVGENVGGNPGRLVWVSMRK